MKQVRSFVDEEDGLYLFALYSNFIFLTLLYAILFVPFLFLLLH